MKIISISTDRKIFESGSDVSLRQIEYGKLFEEIHIIVFSLRKQNFSKMEISQNVFVYPTNSRSRFFYIFDAIRIGKEIVHERKLNRGNAIVTCQDPFETGLAGWRIARCFGFKLHLQIHTDFLSPYFGKHSLLNRVRVVLAKFLLPKADGIRIVSERIKKSIEDIQLKLKAVPVVLPIFVDIERIKNSPVVFDLHTKYPEFDFCILMLGRLESEKNIPLALLSFKEMLKEYPKTGLIIMGDGRELVSLQEMAKKLGLENSVIFESWNTENVFSYLKTADLFLHTAEYEGYGLVLFQASAVALPIVSTDVGIAKEVDATIAEHNPKSVVEKIMEAMKNKIPSKLPHFETKDSYLEKYKKMLEF